PSPTFVTWKWRRSRGSPTLPRGVHLRRPMTRPNLPRRPKPNPRAAAGRAVVRAGSLDPLSSPAYKRAMPHVAGDLNGTVEKIVRIQETAGRLAVPLLYLVDSAGARITDQIDMFPGRRHAGRIFHNQVHLSGAVPQICLLFGPSAAGGAYIPAFCDVVFMVDKAASMYLGSPRMAEMVINEKVTLEEMGGARMHCEVSGCGDL